MAFKFIKAKYNQMLMKILFHANMKDNGIEIENMEKEDVGNYKNNFISKNVKIKII